jgi:hydrogenase maturation factor
MAVPQLPTVTTICTQALKRAGRTTPTAAQIAEAAENALQEVKADVMLVASTHPNLLVTATTVTTEGQQRYAFPNDYNEPYAIQLLDGPEEWQGAAQAGGTSTITLSALMSATEEDIIGKYILITSGFGVEEYREILSYDANSKMASVDSNWASVPNSASSYMIATIYTPLYPYGTYINHDHITAPNVRGTPQLATIFSQEYLIYPVPDDRPYGLLNRYFMDISKLDETGDLFVQLLREWRSLWIQGVAVKTMQRFDEDRYQSELNVYQAMLTGLANQTCMIKPMYFKDV